jgi:hypothetical protein
MRSVVNYKFGSKISATFLLAHPGNPKETFTVWF